MTALGTACAVDAEARLLVKQGVEALHRHRDPDTGKVKVERYRVAYVKHGSAVLVRVPRGAHPRRVEAIRTLVGDPAWAVQAGLW